MAKKYISLKRLSIASELYDFINNELWGKPTDMPWGFKVGTVVLHPSQLYEALLEGFVLFVILWWFSAKQRPYMAVSSMFLLWYCFFRFFFCGVRVRLALRKEKSNLFSHGRSEVAKGSRRDHKTFEKPEGRD